MRLTSNTKLKHMLGTLTTPEIERLLKKEVVGRIGCRTGDRVYVVPISYVYDGECIYCHTHEGLKVEAMRKNPKVCFEVDHLHDMANWQSIIVQGEFEELTHPELRTHGLKLLHQRILPMPSSETTHLSSDWPFLPEQLNRIVGVTFRIRPIEKTGRFEKSPAASTTFFSI